MFLMNNFVLVLNIIPCKVHEDKGIKGNKTDKTAKQALDMSGMT